ncbi:hypothetical protein BGZ97_004103, partial [Linnemannia gamsii]
QLLACLGVSRTWRANFTPQALRHVRFSNLKGHQTWTILHSAGLIRSLTIDIADAGWFLKNNLGPSYYMNLRELHCVDFNYRSKPKPVGYYYTGPSFVDQSQNALQLIAVCPRLRSLTVDNLSCQYRTDHFTEDVFKSIYTHASLAQIKIHLACAPSEFTTVLIKSLPAGLKDFELSIKSWIPNARQFSWSSAPSLLYPKDGYSWQQQQQQGSADSSSFCGSRSLPLERLALGGLVSRPKPGWAIRLLDEDTEPTVVIDHVVPNPETYTSYCYFYNWIRIGFKTVRSLVERSSGLRHLVLKEFSGSWIALLQLLLDTCPDLETIDLSGTTHIYPRDNATSTGIIQLRGSFAALKDFRMSSPLSGQSYTAIAKMVIRSAATLEVVSFSRSNWGQMDEGLNPFHIGTTASWTQCTRLKELGIYRNGGSLMTDYCWETRTAFSIYEPIQDYSTVFGQLEKLHLAVKEPLWDQCPDGYHIGGVAEWNYTWYEFDYYHDEYFGVYFDEKDDEDWKALKVVAATEEEKNHERRRLQAERNHQRAFIIQVRELFGRLKDLKQLQELQIEWSVCSSIFEMSLEHALGLFQETKVQDDTNTLIRSVSAFEKTSRGWWGEVNEEDLLWLCLPWASRPDIESSKVPSDIIKAAARQYENKTQLPGGCNGIPDCSGESLPWSTGDIYNERILEFEREPCDP